MTIHLHTPRRYVSLGDSLSAGISDWGAGDPASGFAPLLAGLIRDQSPDLGFTNLGAGGAKTRDVLLEQADRAIALRPDLVTLVVGANDVPGTPVEEFRRNYSALIGKLRGGTDALIVAATIPNSAHLLPMQFASMRTGIRNRVVSFNRMIRDTAAAYDALVVDLEDDPAAQDRRNLSSDGVHPSARGYRIIAAAFVEVLNQAGYDLAPPALDLDDHHRL